MQIKGLTKQDHGGFVRETTAIIVAFVLPHTIIHVGLLTYIGTSLHSLPILWIAADLNQTLTDSGLELFVPILLP